MQISLSGPRPEAPEAPKSDAKVTKDFKNRKLFSKKFASAGVLMAKEALFVIFCKQMPKKTKNTYPPLPHAHETYI